MEVEVGEGAAASLGAEIEETRALNEAVRARPHDEAAWLRLAEFQAAAEPGGGGAAGGGGGRRQGAVAAKKVAVLRRAVASVPGSEAVRRALLEACEASLPPEEVCRSAAQTPGHQRRA